MLNKKISIIIVNYKSAKLLKKSIDSIREKIKKGTFEIIIVNNDKNLLGSEITSISELKIINNKKNLGFGAGNNIGAKIAKGNILFFLNPDTEILDINSEEVLSLFNNTKLGIIGARLLSANNKIEKWSAGRELSLFNLIRNNLGCPVSQKFLFTQKPIKTDWVSGAALFIRKDVFEKVSGFDENFFMYFEDMDLCKKIKKIKKEILYFPKIVIKHYNGKSYQNKKIQKRDYYKSQKYYFKKNRGFFEWIVVKLISKLFYNV